MTVGGLLLAGAQKLGFSVPAIFLALAGLNLVAAIVMLKILPTNPMRDAISILYRAIFRMEVKGLENLEKAGEAPILALNHVSLLDAGLALTLTTRSRPSPSIMTLPGAGGSNPSCTLRMPCRSTRQNPWPPAH